MRHRCASCGTNRARPPRSASSACFSHAAALVERLLWSLGPDGPTGGCTRAQDQEPGLIGCCPHAWLNAMVGGAKALALASQLKLCGRLLHPHALDGRGDRDRVAVVRARVPRPPSCARRDPCRSPHRSHTRAPPTVNLAPCAPALSAPPFACAQVSRHFEDQQCRRRRRRCCPHRRRSATICATINIPIVATVVAAAAACRRGSRRASRGQMFGFWRCALRCSIVSLVVVYSVANQVHAVS